MLRYLIERLTGESVDRPLRLIATACAVGAVVYIIIAIILGA